MELHFDDIPSKELENILQQKCQLPPSYSKKMVAVMRDLQVHCLWYIFSWSVGEVFNTIGKALSIWNILW